MATWITRREAAERLGVSKTAIANMILAGKLTSGPKIDGKTTVDEVDVAAYKPHLPPTASTSGSPRAKARDSSGSRSRP